MKLWKLLIPSGLFLCFGLYRLHDIPAEWFVDIYTEHEFVLNILHGRWPWYFSLSAGPLYHYFAAVCVLLFGDTYFVYKIASVVMGLLGILSIYMLGRELIGSSVAFTASFLAAASFWTLVWSRLGSSPQILSPVISAVAIFFAVRFGKRRSIVDLVIGGLVSTLGLFSYPGLFILPCTYAVLAGWEILRMSDSRAKHSMFLIGSLVPGVVLFLSMILGDRDLFFGAHGYIGSKILVSDFPLSTIVRVISYNITRTIGMFHIRGDEVFRINIPYRPHLDPITGALFVLGILTVVRAKENRILIYTIVPMLFLLLPSIAPAIPVHEIPSSGRTFAVTPFVYLIAACGCEQIVSYIGRFHRYASRLVRFCLILGILGINTYAYFCLYPKGLPNQNSPYGTYIARYIDTLPSTMPVFLSSCCWGEWGQPDPKNIYYALKHKDGRVGLMSSRAITCDDIIHTPHGVVIVDPNDQSRVTDLMSCREGMHDFTWADQIGQRVFSTVRW